MAAIEGQIGLSEAVLVEVCEWLGISWSEEAAFAVGDERNASATYKSEAWGNLLHGVAARLRRSGLGAMVEKLKGAGPVAVMLKANKHDFRETVPKMSDELRLRLAKQLQPDMEAVAVLLARPDLPWKSLALARGA